MSERYTGLRSILIGTSAALAVIVALTFLPTHGPGERILSHEATTVKMLRELNIAQRIYAQDTKQGFACKIGELGVGSAGRTLERGYVDAVLASGERTGYKYKVLCTSGSKPMEYSIVAVPVELGISGKRAYCTDQSGRIWSGEAGSAENCLTKANPIER